MAKTKKTRSVARWVCADKRALRVADIGDDHLVNILRMIETELGLFGSEPTKHALHRSHAKFYPTLVAEGLRRGLFEWAPKRKYLAASIEKADAFVAATTSKVRVARAR